MSADRARIEELAALAAAGAASAEERAELDALAAADPSAADQLALFEDVAAALALSLEPIPAPEGALEGIRSALGGTAAAAETETEPRAEIPEYARRHEPIPRVKDEGADIISLAARRRQRAVAGFAAVALAAAAAFLFLWLRERGTSESELAAAARDAEQAIESVRTKAQRTIDDLADELRKSRDATKTLEARFQPLVASSLRLATLRGETGGFAHVLAGADGRRWLVIGAELPPIPDDKDYQLWFVPEGGKPVSAGLLRAGPDGLRAATPTVPDELAGKTVRPALSLEPFGGSPQPTEVKMIGEPI